MRTFIAQPVAIRLLALLALADTLLSGLTFVWALHTACRADRSSLLAAASGCSQETFIIAAFVAVSAIIAAIAAWLLLGGWVLSGSDEPLGRGAISTQTDTVSDAPQLPEAAGDAPSGTERDRNRAADWAETSDDWLWETDAEGRLTFVSAGFFRITGLNADKQLGRRWTDIASDFDPADAYWRAHLNDVAARRSFQDFLFTVGGTAGQRRLIANGKPFFAADGSFAGYRCAARDITAQCDAEDAVARSAGELLAAGDALRAANAVKSSFLTSMSHELRTPLNAILGFSEMIRDAHVGPLDQRYRDYAGHIHEAATLLLRLIDEVLDLSAVEIGALDLAEEPVDMRALIEDCYRTELTNAEARKVKIALATSTDLPLLRGDSARLKKILESLLSNAVKFTPSGGRVTISAQAPSRGGLLISVADTGIGMRPEEIPKALEVFRQLDSPWDRRFSGAGLGLSLAKALTERHGGKLEISSAPGRGTEVRVFFPERRIATTTPSVGS
jgi:PAS domain S-box-containing protein